MASSVINHQSVFTMRQYSTPTNTNAGVKPFGAYAETNLDSDIQLYGVPIASYALCRSGNPTLTAFSIPRNAVFTYSNTASNEIVTYVLYSKNVTHVT